MGDCRSKSSERYTHVSFCDVLTDALVFSSAEGEVCFSVFLSISISGSGKACTSVPDEAVKRWTVVPALELNPLKFEIFNCFTSNPASRRVRPRAFKRTVHKFGVLPQSCHCSGLWINVWMARPARLRVVSIPPNNMSTIAFRSSSGDRLSLSLLCVTSVDMTSSTGFSRRSWIHVSTNS